MSSKNAVVIRVEGIGKKYHIHHQGPAHHQSLRDAISEAMRALMAGPGHGQQDKLEDFWAIRDISFDVHQGERLGIIGRNGAGKSTLLKLLSRVTSPSRGRISLKGRVGSLLEVGTGFHPELTGRENVFLNGAILGMNRNEIKRKFDEIVAYAEIEKFLDTPVKRYSSGMYVRLAFAVAAHLESDILLVDEVLAVGDAQFQKKCLGTMQRISEREGRTVLLVSHNMVTIQSLCERTIMLEKGRFSADGETSAVVNEYFRKNNDFPDAKITNLEFHQNRRPGSLPVFSELQIFPEESASSAIRMGDAICIKTSFRHVSAIANIRLGIVIEDAIGQRILALSPTMHAPNLIQTPVNEGTFVCRVPNIRLFPGTYYVTLIIGNGTTDLDYIDRAARLVIEVADVFGTGYTPQYGHGIFYQEAAWSFETKER